MRTNGRAFNQLRTLQITRDYLKHAEGSALIEMGDTKIICSASVQQGVPIFLRGQGQGWVTAEYNMLPRATKERNQREATRGKQGGRTLEIQRLIGRAMRQALNLKALGEYTITLDCDVIQADGGTRTAAITGSCVALVDALAYMGRRGWLTNAKPLRSLIAAISVGIVNGTPMIDLDYKEDSSADTDMNVVMNEQGQFIEIQGTAEHVAFSQPQLNSLLELAGNGISQLFNAQKQVLANTVVGN